ncbi:MAG: hypothetical protein HUJ68_14295, partial [Clostridia bacterium]|nr:hypothetical protein [Clostridia bacterium]
MFNFEIKDIINNEVVVINNKELYNLDNKTKLSEWTRVGTRGGKTKEVPTSTNGFNCGNKIKSLREDAFGVLVSDSNSRGVSATGVFFTNTRANSNAGSIQILYSNLDRCCVNFSARKLTIQGINWTNEKDPCLAPNTNHSDYDEFVFDSLVYSLFHSSSNQCSLKNFGINKNYNMINEFFFMSKEDMEKLSNKYSNYDCYNDIISSEKERFIYRIIEKIEKDNNFSKEAKEVLDLAIELVKDSFVYRQQFNNSKPEYQINNWDCGWYQIRNLINWI